MEALSAKLFPLKTTGCVISQTRDRLQARLSVTEIRGHVGGPQILTWRGGELGEFSLLIAFEKSGAVSRAGAPSLEEGSHKQGRIFACSQGCQVVKD